MSRAARLGAFIIATLGILVLGVVIIGNQQYLFSSTYQLKSQFATVAGLSAGADVEVGGVHSGTVRSIDLPHEPGGKVTVVMDLSKSTHEIIKRDSVASIETEGLLGNQFMAISFGSAGTSDVRDGDTIAGAPPLQMADMIKKTNAILDSSQQAVDNASRMTANLASISAKVDNGKGTAGSLVNDKQLYANLTQTTSDARDMMLLGSMIHPAGYYRSRRAYVDLLFTRPASLGQPQGDARGRAGGLVGREQDRTLLAAD